MSHVFTPLTCSYTNLWKIGSFLHQTVVLPPCVDNNMKMFDTFSGAMLYLRPLFNISRIKKIKKINAKVEVLSNLQAKRSVVLSS